MSQQDINNQKVYTLDLNLEPGVYILNLENEKKEVLVEKLIIQ
jgi:hypothetical protein